MSPQESEVRVTLREVYGGQSVMECCDDCGTIDQRRATGHREGDQWENGL